MGFRKGMAWLHLEEVWGSARVWHLEEVSFLHVLFCHFLVYADIKDHETNNSSCLIIFHHVSSKSSNQEEIPNLTVLRWGSAMAAFGGGILFTFCFGGSKYPKSGVPQGYGCIWRRYPFYIFVSSFLGLCGYQRPRNKQFIMSYHISSRLI